MTYRIGDVVPIERARGPFGAPCEPRWYIMVAGRQRAQMRRACDWLTGMGAADAWFPERAQFRTLLRRSGKRSTKVQVTVKRPAVPGILFVLTSSEPQWDVLLDVKGIRPMQLFGHPVIAQDRDMLNMAEMPERIAAAVAAEAEAKRLHVQDRATIADGLLLGAVNEPVTIIGLRADGVTVRTAGGVEITLPASNLRKIVDKPAV